MKIIFLCGSMEPGRDGVGDYVRRLSLDMISQGQEVSVIALNDKHIQIKEDSLQDIQGEALTVLRIRSGISDSKRFSIAKRFVDDVNPEWISLQFVIFSYHPKGLPFLLNHFLSKIGKGRKWHFMFHELWVGMASDAKPMEKYWGFVQRYLIRSMIRKLKPEIIHTNTNLYK